MKSCLDRSFKTSQYDECPPSLHLSEGENKASIKVGPAVKGETMEIA